VNGSLLIDGNRMNNRKMRNPSKELSPLDAGVGVFGKSSPTSLPSPLSAETTRIVKEKKGGTNCHCGRIRRGGTMPLLWTWLSAGNQTEAKRRMRRIRSQIHFPRTGGGRQRRK
jgi:hypothetical protein